ncbi:hypothetical protein AAFC00_000959 [Neodothiora populina]|uniref:Metallo-beta-lactamase domain-containing protein n=1 Tax=Neodothiora populina TaxID=2781224 RepID=A0ABR3PMD4_9PEZI
MDGEDLLLCPVCGTQYDVPADEPLNNCHICDDPRQYVPPTGQKWTSLGAERGKHENKWVAMEGEERITSITAEPKLGIGQRALLIETQHGNVLWDCIAYLSDELVEFINSKGGLCAIVISHPHFYTTHLTWSSVFSCPVYIHSADREWLSRKDSKNTRRYISDATHEILPGVTAIQCGGHFPGSMVLHWEKHLFIADTFINVPAALTPPKPHEGMNSYAFMWSIPNMIPLPPHTISRIWAAVRPFEFEATHGLFVGFDIAAKDVKGRVLESMKIQTRMQGFEEADILDEVWS